MPANKKANYNVELKINKLHVIEERVLDLKSGSSILSRKIKTENGCLWIREKDFNIIFKLVVDK